MKSFLKIFLILFVVFSMIISTAMYFYFKNDVNEATQNNETKVTDQFDDLNISTYKERVNILLLGVDTLENDGSGIGTRTDTIMVLSIDPLTKTGFLLSIPRDTRVEIANGGGYDKVNHAHSYGGTELALSTIKNFLDIPIHHYIKVDYRALFKTVDDLGGIEVDVPVDMRYVDSVATPPLNVNLKKGVQTLNGEQAMGFLRFRKGYANQDLGRIQAQQMFLDSLFKKIKSPSSIINIPKYLDTMSKYVETDMTMKDMLVVAKQALTVDANRIEKKTIPGEPTMTGGISYYSVNEEEMDADMMYLLSGDYPVPETEIVEDPNVSSNSQSGEVNKASNNQTVLKNTTEISAKKVTPQKDTKSYKIHVMNGNGVSGIARRASDLLKIEDISVTATGNANDFNVENTIIYYKDDLIFANKIKGILRTGKVQEGTKSIVSSEPDIVIVLGKDFS